MGTTNPQDYMTNGDMVFPGTGIRDNRADKVRKMDISVYCMATGRA